MSIVKGYSKKNNTTYLYEQDMKWNPETGRPEGTRKLIGKLDPETGMMIPTGKRGRPRKSTEAAVAAETDAQIRKLQDQLDDLTSKNQELFNENSRLKQMNRDYERKIQSIIRVVNNWNSAG